MEFFFSNTNLGNTIHYTYTSYNTYFRLCIWFQRSCVSMKSISSLSSIDVQILFSVFEVSGQCFILVRVYKPKTVLSVRERTDRGPQGREQYCSFSHRMYSLRLLSYLKHCFLCVNIYWIVSGNIFKNFVSHQPLSSEKPVLQS